MKTIAFLDAGTLRLPIVSNRLNLQSSGLRFDWRMFVHWLGGKWSDKLFDVHYYDAMPETPTKELGHFHAFLQQELKIQLHFTPLRAKRKSCPHCNSSYTQDEQKGVDVAIALHMFRLSPHYEQAILVSGDGDFSDVVHSLRQDCGRRVIVVGWGSGIASQLRAAANEVVHLEDYAKEFLSRST